MSQKLDKIFIDIKNKRKYLNWLAHVFLSELDIDFQIGNFLADPLKGRVWENASDEIKKGMQTHKKIDSFTDSHEIISCSKKRLRERGLLKPVIVDLTYDYLLTKNWDKFCTIPLESAREIPSIVHSGSPCLNNVALYFTTDLFISS